MAGISSYAPKEMALAGGRTVAGQMDLVTSKASGLIGWGKKPALLGPAVISQLKVLYRTGKAVRILISSAEEREIDVSREVGRWLEEVNAAILTANGVLDECKHHESCACKETKDKVWIPYFSSLGRQRTLSNRLKSVNSMLQKAHKHGKELVDGEPGKGTSACAAAPEAGNGNVLSQLESQVVEDGVQTVVDKLLDPDSDHLSVIFLVGWGECGKTVLARLAYKNISVMRYFDERMWVQVPVDLGADTISRRMLTNLGVAATEEDPASLKKRLQGKRFLLVLVGASDINPDMFRVLKEFLEELGGFSGSTVLIITGRKFLEMKPSFVHRMRLGTRRYCWTLFEKIAFAEGGPIRTPKMEVLGEAIVDLCAGNSLYIKLVGSLTYRFKDEIQWRGIIEKLTEMKGSGHGGRIPQLCFDYMNSLPLKRCFQYCYFFPKGCLMRREELIELWMALGYLNVQERIRYDIEEDLAHLKVKIPHFQDSGNGSVLTMEALGEQYYDILMKSSFLQVSEDDDFGTQSCKVPDGLHHLNLLNEDSRVCFKTIVKGDAMDCSGAQHLTLTDCELKYSKSLKDRFSKLQSLRLENTKGLADILVCARGLRVLIVVDESLTELPDSIGKLTHLRYLDISGTRIVKLPDSISKLCNLQTLRLHDLVDLPTNFDNVLKRMMHLYIHVLQDLYDMYPLLSKCGKLVYLSSAKAMLKVSVDKEGRIDHTNLHKLSNRCSTIIIHCLENASKAGSGINEWLSKIPAGIETLNLSWSARRGNRIDEDVLDRLEPTTQSLKELTLENFKGTRFASWMIDVDCDLLSNLVKLELENCSWCEKLPPLGHLSCLRILKIVGMDNVQSIEDKFYGDSSGSGPVFAKLREFTLCRMSKLEDWRGSTPPSTKAFPYLERFEVDQCHSLMSIPDIVLTGKPKCFRRFKVSHCDKLTHLPQGLGELKCLEDLELFGLPALEHFSIGNATNLKSLIIGCVSAEKAERGLLMQLENLSSLRNLTIWGYHQKSIPDCLGKLCSLEALKFESCQHLNNLPQIITSLKKLHICYCPALEDSCIRGSRPEWPKVSHIETIVVNNETIREPPKPTEKNTYCGIMSAARILL